MRRANVALIVLDTLRYDQLACCLATTASTPTSRWSARARPKGTL